MKFSQLAVDQYFTFPGDPKSYQKISLFGYKHGPDFAVLGEQQIAGDPEVEVKS